MSENSNILIDGWHIDASSYRLSRNGDEKKLEPRSMELLLYLADHPDRVVTREEIEENVWQGRVVGYDALSNAIAKIRKAFGVEPLTASSFTPLPSRSSRQATCSPNLPICC